MKNRLKLRSFVTIAMLSSISFILMFLNFPLPYFPVFLEIDFSDVPALIAAIIMGPVAGILVELIKNILNWLFMGAPTGVPVGHMANFATGLLFILPVYYIYKRMSNLKGLRLGLVAGTFSMAIGMSILNYVAFLPMYTYFLGMGTFDMKEMIVLGILPFNIIKGILIMVLVLMLFRTMKKWIEDQRAQYLLQKQ
ncbi:MAG: ECF transporter S component [Lysinibacillus sp.]|nr:ECF transporter S component [Lysinibacillus sp.]